MNPFGFCFIEYKSLHPVQNKCVIMYEKRIIIDNENVIKAEGKLFYFEDI